jgi:nucleoid-associated protein YgaU
MPSRSFLPSCFLLFVVLTGCAAPTVSNNFSSPPTAASAADSAATNDHLSSPAEPSPATTAIATQQLPATPHPSTYIVNEGETLWLIAARNEIYADPLLWPLLYKANRDQIKDPAHIFPGQQLNIPRNLSDAEYEKARDTARNSDLFPATEATRAPTR